MDQPQPPSRFAWRKTPFFVTFPAVLLPMFLAMIDQTIVATALPAIGAEFGRAQTLSWIVVVYLFAAAVAAPVYGRLGDLWGRARLIQVALVISTLASVLCALAPTIELLIMARFLQGLGGGGLMTLSQALIGEAVAPRERAGYQGYLASVGVTANALGPIIGGLLAEHLGWRAIFLLNVPFGILALALITRLAVGRGTGGRFGLDVPGILLLAVLTGAMLLTMPRLQALDLLGAAGLVAAAALAGVLFVWWEGRAPSPIFPLSLLRQPAVWRTDALAACHGAIIVSLFTFVPFYFRVASGASPSELGLLLLPVPIGIGTGSLLTGRMVRRTGRTTIFPILGLLSAATTLTVLALASSALSPWQMSLGLGVCAFFLGPVMGVVQLTVQLAAGSTMLGSAAASVQFARGLGAAFGTALVAAVMFAMLGRHGPDAIGLFAGILEGGPDVLLDLPLSARTAMQTAISEAFRAAFLTMAAIALAAIAFAVSIPIRRL